MAEEKKVRIAALSDLHIRDTDKGKWTEVFKEASNLADIMILCGDLTDTGDEYEAEILAQELHTCSIPVVGVLGNHDYEKDRHKLIRQIITQGGNVHILDGEAVVIKEIGFAGVKGFGGGFDNYMLSMFGEKAMKDFVQEAVHEALRLDRALARLDAEYGAPKKIAITHYAPTSETILGEPEPIFPFLGSSRLAEPLNRRQVIAAFHGHAHAGRLEGKTPGGVRVFNVSRHILSRERYPHPFYVFEA